jgi:CheY-like chemotaxis protein
VYSVAATAAMIGVPIAILVGWEEADIVRPGTTPSGARLYSRDDLEDLVAVKRAITTGQTLDEARELVRAARRRRQAGPFGARGSGRRMLVLLAERDPYAAEMAEYFLRTEGYDVDVAFSAQEAESRAGQRVPDVSVVELLISGGAGAELCARLKAQAGNAVVAISTLDLEDAALRAGADAFLTKPLDQLQLISTIKDLLGESAMLREGTGQ